jgi:hypothetical protein
MSKKKAKVCTILLIIVVFGLLFLSCFLGFDGEPNLFNIITSFIAGSWLGEKVYMFYNWLLEKEEK